MDLKNNKIKLIKAEGGNNNMSTRLYKAISVRGNHEIGNLNTIWAKHIVNGAKLVCEDKDEIDNFTLVELGEYDEEGNLTCKPLSDHKKKGYLLTTVEEEQLMEGETYVDFFNTKDEMVRLTRLETGVRFETSAIELNAGVKEAKQGMVAHFDATKKKYIISNPLSAHASYAESVNKFNVVSVNTDFGFAFDKQTVRLECQ
uniref:Phage virion protein n=2 Tax=Clostridium haemolyticum TaxID=84025 RepID=A0ABR4TB54_CLOHA|nr:phage virion protein [Clostridium haemolyticum NCTC 9693]